MKVSEVLYKAGNIIASRGLLKYELGKKDGSVCSFGAINEVLCGDPMEWYDDRVYSSQDTSQDTKDIGNAAAIMLANAIGQEYSYLAEIIIEWNNSPERTKEEVVAAFSKAALIAESAEMSEEQL